MNSELNTRITQRELREELRIKPRTWQLAWRKAFGESADAKAHCTQDQCEVMRRLFAKSVSAKSDLPAPPSTPPAPRKPIRQAYINNRVSLLWIPFSAATLSSLKNLWFIFINFSGSDYFTASVLTFVFGATSMLFIYSRVNSIYISTTTFATLAFEAFSNATGFYYAVLGKNSVPTHFLSVITDMFETGTHLTALFISISMALIISSIQVVSLLNLRIK